MRDQRYTLGIAVIFLTAILMGEKAKAEVLNKDCDIDAKVNRITTSHPTVAIEGVITNWANNPCECVQLTLDVSVHQKKTGPGQRIGASSVVFRNLETRNRQSFESKFSIPPGTPTGFATAGIQSLKFCGRPVETCSISGRVTGRRRITADMGREGIQTYALDNMALRTLDHEHVKSASLNGNGSYVFTNIPVGSYELGPAEAFLLEPSWPTIDCVGQTVPRDFFIRGLTVD